MKKLILLLFLSGPIVYGQTKLISHKSHSGKKNTFKKALARGSFEIVNSNFGPVSVSVYKKLKCDQITTEQRMKSSLGSGKFVFDIETKSFWSRKGTKWIDFGSLYFSSINKVKPNEIIDPPNNLLVINDFNTQVFIYEKWQTLKEYSLNNILVLDKSYTSTERENLELPDYYKFLAFDSTTNTHWILDYQLGWVDTKVSFKIIDKIKNHVIRIYDVAKNSHMYYRWSIDSEKYKRK